MLLPPLNKNSYNSNTSKLKTVFTSQGEDDESDNLSSEPLVLKYLRDLINTQNNCLAIYKDSLENLEKRYLDIHSATAGILNMQKLGVHKFRLLKK